MTFRSATGSALGCAFADDRKLIVAGDARGHVHFRRFEEPKNKLRFGVGPKRACRE